MFIYRVSLNKNKKKKNHKVTTILTVLCERKWIRSGKSVYNLFLIMEIKFVSAFERQYKERISILAMHLKAISEKRVSHAKKIVV